MTTSSRAHTGANPAITLFDKDGNEIGVSLDGGLSLAVRDEEQLNVLRAIHAELRKIRFVLERGQDISVSDLDLDEELSE
jgi:hypothetical protein